MHTLRRLTVLLVLFAWLVAACGPAAPEALPTEEIAQVVPSDTPEPTATKPPPSPTKTATPVPPTDTPTPVPPTKTPRPTPTATPGPGDVVYAPIYETDWRRWDTIYFGTEDFEVEPDNEFLNINIDGEDTWVYVTYGGGFDHADIQLDVDVTVVSGPNRNNLSIVCRYSELGWYEFNVLSGGLWTIFKYDEVNGYRELASGGSTAIQMGQSENHLTAECIGDTLTFYINDVKVGSAKDAAFIDGSFGMSASTFDIGKLNVRFRDYTVRLADPEANLGNAVAPTVPPNSGGGGGGDTGPGPLDNFFNLPVPGDTLGNDALQFDTLFRMSILALLDAPDGCMDIRVVGSQVGQITQPFAFDAQNNLTAGAWTERWTVNACGVNLAYNVTYVADGAGGINFSVSR